MQIYIHSRFAPRSASVPPTFVGRLCTTSGIKRGITPFVLTLALAVIIIRSSNAATLVWDADANGANGATDGSGTWDAATTANWYNGTATDQTFGGTATAPNIASFGVGGTSGTVLVSGTINLGGITFNQGGYTLNATSLNSGVLNFVPTTAGGSVFFTTSGAGQVSTINDNVSFTATGGNANNKFVKTGAGTLVLNQTNSTGTVGFSNPTFTVTGGTFSSSTGTFDSILQIGGAVGRALGTNGTIALDSGTVRLAALFNGSSMAGASRAFTVSANGGAIVDATSGTGNNNNSIQANITDNAGSGTSLFLSNSTGITTQYQNVISGSGGITTSGGTTNLSGANTYAGATVVRSGTMSLDNNGSTSPRLVNTSGITVGSGGTLLLVQGNGAGGTLATPVVSNDRIKNTAPVTLSAGATAGTGGIFKTGGLNEGPAGGMSGSSAAMGALTLSANSTIDFTSGAVAAGSNLLFSSLTYTAGDDVRILNWTGIGGSDNAAVSNDRLLFTTDPGFTEAQLSAIQFYSDAGTTAFATGASEIVFNGYYEIVPVPEPATWVAGILVCGLLYVARRRQIGGWIARASA